MRALLCGLLVSVTASGAVEAAQISDPVQPVSGRPAYCVNAAGEFYVYTGDLCRSGYQLGPGNCLLPGAELIAVSRAECLRRGGMPAMQDGSAPMPRAPLLRPTPAPNR
jgi:hypothetical protein